MYYCQIRDSHATACHALIPAMLLQETANRFETAPVSMLIRKSLEKPHDWQDDSASTVLIRCGPQDRPNSIQNQRELRKTLSSDLNATSAANRLAAALHLTHFVTRMMKLWRCHECSCRPDEPDVSGRNRRHQLWDSVAKGARRDAVGRVRAE